MSLEIVAKVGPQVSTDGSLIDPRLGKSGEVIAQDAHAARYERNYRGALFTAQSAIAGVVAQGATTLAATCAFALWNPPNSGINAVIERLTIGIVSGTLGVGTYVWAVCPQTAALGGTAIVPTNLKLPGGLSAVAGSGAKCTCATGSSAVGATPTLLKGTGISHGAIAGAATQGNAPWVVNEDGGIEVPPGVALVLFDVGTAGTSDKLIYSLDWEEVAV